MHIVVFTIAASCALCGCERGGSEVNASGNVPKATNDVAFISIDGEPVTATQVSNAVMVIAKIQELRGKPVSKGNFSKWANAQAMTIFPGLISAQLWENEIRRIGLVAAEEDVSAALSRYGKLLKRDSGSLDSLAGLFGDVEPAFRRQFGREVKFCAYKRKYFDVSVGDEDLRSYYADKTNLLIKAEKINAEARRKGSAAWKELNGGAPWEEVAPKYTEDRLLDKRNSEYWREWLEFRPKDHPLPEVGEAVMGLKAGEWTKPFETEEGLMIVKVLNVDNGIYACARILIRMGVVVDFPDVEAARREIAREKESDAQQELFERLKENARIEYPMGESFKYDIWPVERKQKRTLRKLK